MNYGSFLDRLIRGVKWTWVNEDYRARLPGDFDVGIMALESRDRFHAKQGRSTARVVLNRPDRPLAVYLKRHFRLPLPARLGALVDPGGRYSPGAAEWHHLERVRALGIDVPDVVAAGERIGPGAVLTSFLMLAELTGREPVNEALPALAARLDRDQFDRLKRAVIADMARITATLHKAHVFHKDLYLCHFFLDPGSIDPDGRPARLTLIDLHRLAHHRLAAEWWRAKDLAQLLYSTTELAEVTDRDRARFWKSYRRLVGLKRSRWRAKIIRMRAARYLAHNRASRQTRQRGSQGSLQSGSPSVR